MSLESVPDFYRSQIGGSSVINYSYTDSPWILLYYDTLQFLRHSWALPWIILPAFDYGSGELDELYPTWGNIFCLLMHLVLGILHVGFLAAIPVATVMLPLWPVVLGIIAFLLANVFVCKLLNGSAHKYHSDEKYAKPLPQHSHEQWVFINGVAVGEHWMKSNLNRIALTFGRPVVGIHNRTLGIIFDVLECLIQRNFGYATSDVRAAYRLLKDILYDPEKSKVILILHSQGGIIGGMCLDWLLQEMPQDLLSKIEVYTFGNAANHFNNPHRHALAERLMRSKPEAAMATLLREVSVTTPDSIIPDPMSAGGSSNAEPDVAAQPPSNLPRERSSISSLSSTRTSIAAYDRAISHIEHYAHSTDFVAIWGILHFATNKVQSPMIPRFLGRLFVRARGGHQLSQHYLDGMFPLKRNPATGEFTGADEDNEFMDEDVEVGNEGDATQNAREAFDITYAGTRGFGTGEITTPVEVHGLSPHSKVKRRHSHKVKVRDLSRLWSYRNGMSPRDNPPLLLANLGMGRNATL